MSEGKKFKKNVEPSVSTDNAHLVEDLVKPDAARSSDPSGWPTGLFGSAAVGDEGPKYIKTENEKFIEGNTNCGIVLGKNRPGSRASGYGGKGDTQCAEITFYTGLGTSDGRAYTDSGERLYCDFQTKEQEGNENTETSSYFVLSEKADIDRDLGLSSTPGVFNAEARSCFVIKADVGRIVAREGLRFVTGTSGENSKGAKISHAAGIDLCAGNLAEEMQPMVKGANLIECIRTLAKRVNDLKGVFDKFVEYQMDLNNTIMSHDHIIPMDPVAQALGLPAPGLKAAKSPVLLIKGIQTNIKCLSRTKFSNLVDTFNMGNFEKKYLMETGEAYICSKYNNLN